LEDESYRSGSFHLWVRDLLDSLGILVRSFDEIVDYLKVSSESVYWLSYRKIYNDGNYEEEYIDFIGFVNGGALELTNLVVQAESLCSVRRESGNFEDVLTRVYGEQGEDVVIPDHSLHIEPDYLTLYRIILDDPHYAQYLKENEVVFRREVAQFVVDRVLFDLDHMRSQIDTVSDKELRHLKVYRLYAWMYYNCKRLGLDVERIGYVDQREVDEWYIEIESLHTLLVAELKTRLLG